MQRAGDAAAMRAPASRVRQQTVVNVHSTQRKRRPRQLAQGGKERGGIGAAAEGDTEPRLRKAGQQLAEAPL